MYILYFVCHPFVDGQLGCFRLLKTMFLFNEIFFFCCVDLCGCRQACSALVRGLPAVAGAASHRSGFSCGAWALGASRFQYVKYTDLAAPWNVGLSATRDRTCVTCVSRQMLNHWTIGKSCFYLLLLPKIVLWTWDPPYPSSDCFQLFLP